MTDDDSHTPAVQAAVFLSVYPAQLIASFFSSCRSLSRLSLPKTNRQVQDTCTHKGWSYERGLSLMCDIRLWLVSGYVFGFILDLGSGIRSETCLLHACVLHKEKSSSSLCKIMCILNCKSDT